MKMKDKIKKIVISRYFIGTILVILVYTLYLIIAKVTPFGKNTMLKSDAYSQYSYFLAYYHDALLKGKGIFQSWELGLGNNFYTTFAYYLCSPFNLLVIFFNKNQIYEFIEIVTLLKLITIFNAMMIYLNKVFQYKKRGSIIFALIYTFSSYTICYLFHIIWLDALYMLPITLLFVEKFIKNEKIYPVTICIGLCLIFQYYVGFSVTLFTVCYYIARILMSSELKNGKWKMEIKKFIKFIIGIILGVGISMVVFLPSFMQSKGLMNKKIDWVNIEKDKIPYIFNVIFNNYEYMLTQKVCLLFASTLILVLIPLYYCNSAITKREKIVSSLLLILLLLPIISPIINKIWHGMTNPNCFYYRYSFCIMFTLVTLAFRTFINQKGNKFRQMYLSLVIFMCLTIIEIILKSKGKLDYEGFTITYKSIVISAVIFIIMWFSYAFIAFSKKEINKLVSSVIMYGIIIIDICISIYSYQNSNQDNYRTLNEVKNYDRIGKKISSLVGKDIAQNRILFNPDKYSTDMNMKYGYSTIDYFTSARNKQIIRNMYSLGYSSQRDTALWLTAYSGSSFNYSMAGIKYYISKNKLNEDELYGYEFLEKFDDYYIYENKLSLPMVYYLKENISLNEIDSAENKQEKNPFEIQNEILNNINDTDSEKFYYSIDKLKNSKNVVNDDKYYYINYCVQSYKNINLYLFSHNKLNLIIDGKTKFDEYSGYWSTDVGIKPILHLNNGESKTFTIQLPKDIYEKHLDELYIYACDNEQVEKVIKKAQELNLQNNINVKKNEIQTHFNSYDDGYVCFEISYDSGWRAIVNGKKAETIKINGAFLGVKVGNGENNIKLYFIPRYFRSGLMLTLFSIASVVFILIYDERKNKYSSF